MKINWGFGRKASYATELVSLLRGRVRKGARDMSCVHTRTETVWKYLIGLSLDAFQDEAGHQVLIRQVSGLVTY